MERFVSAQAPQADSFCRDVLAWVSHRVGRTIAFDASGTWLERQVGLHDGQYAWGWVCGWTYARHAAHGPWQLVAAPAPRPWPAAPWPAAPWPAYHVDLIVPADSTFDSLASLRGATWAYNEPESWSGYHAVRRHLAREGWRPGDFFGRLVESGSHGASLALVATGAADCAAIDHTVFQLVAAAQPEVAAQLRIVARLGPYPRPPWVAHTSVPPAQIEPVRAALLDMHRSADGRAILHRWHTERFDRVSAAAYQALLD